MVNHNVPYQNGHCWGIPHFQTDANKTNIFLIVYSQKNTVTSQLKKYCAVHDLAMRISFKAQIRILCEYFQQFDQVFWRCFASTYSHRHGWNGGSWEIHASTINGCFDFLLRGMFHCRVGLQDVGREKDEPHDMEFRLPKRQESTRRTAAVGT